MTNSHNVSSGWRAGIVKELLGLLAEPSTTRIQVRRLLGHAIEVAVEIAEELAAFEVDPPPALVDACDAIGNAAELFARVETLDGGQ